MKTKKFVALLGVILPVAALPAIAASCGKTEEKKTEEVNPTPAPTPAPTPEPAPAPTPKEGTGSNEGTGNDGSGTTSPNTTPAVAPVTASPAEIAAAKAENAKTVNTLKEGPKLLLAQFEKLITAVNAENKDAGAMVTKIRDDFKKDYEAKKDSDDKDVVMSLRREGSAALEKAKKVVVEFARTIAQEVVDYYNSLSVENQKKYDSYRRQAEARLKVNTSNDMGSMLYTANKLKEQMDAVKAQIEKGKIASLPNSKEVGDDDKDDQKENDKQAAEKEKAKR
ncbi:variable surface lipoprotein [Mycoplasma struthionis]|uniref:Variable surface lipoprotein n=1 Tax=Mycoplasma struthionis TaxID=538220 RepID=A0A3G8LGY5_9MOLU|nr:variable surface lipoprotein [Mycoplasma struthionis]AZG68594.1 hypothetical protein EGN60_01245 [Mycoplasma struthionis]